MHYTNDPINAAVQDWKVHSFGVSQKPRATASGAERSSADQPSTTTHGSSGRRVVLEHDRGCR